MRKSSAVHRTDYDGAWKVALDRYLEPFLRLCFPLVHAGIDWSYKAIPLDQELQEVVRDAETGKHRVDTLFKVRRHDGTEDWILVHVEVQSQPDRRLPQRLYRYYCKEDIQELFRVIDWFVQLPAEQEIEFRRKIAEYESQKHMPYITSIERMGREEGLQQGLAQGRQEGRQEGFVAARQKAVLDALEIRFGEVADAVRQRIESVQDEARLRALLKSAIQAGSIEEFTQTL